MQLVDHGVEVRGGPRHPWAAPLEVEIKVKATDKSVRPTRSHSILNSFASDFHLLSTNAFVLQSITILSGQGRVKPSVGHLRVALMPIFEP